MNPQGSRMGHERLVLDVAQLELDLSALVAGAPAGCVPARGWPGAPRERLPYPESFAVVGSSSTAEDDEGAEGAAKGERRAPPPAEVAGACPASESPAPGRSECRSAAPIGKDNEEPTNRRGLPPDDRGMA